jgi:hypothetical protein
MGRTTRIARVDFVLRPAKTMAESGLQKAAEFASGIETIHYKSTEILVVFREGAPASRWAVKSMGRHPRQGLESIDDTGC